MFKRGRSVGWPMDTVNVERLNVIVRRSYNDRTARSVWRESCVVAYEARRRGYDVQSLPFKEDSEMDRLSSETNLAWIDPRTGKHPDHIGTEVDDPPTFVQWMEDNLERSQIYA